MDCPICGQYPKEGFKVKYVEVEKCSGCGHIYAVGVAQDHGLQQYPGAEAFYIEFSGRNDRLINIFKREGFLFDHCRLLDFGAGPGHLLRSLAKRMPKVDITCTEADTATAQYLRVLGFKVFADLAEAEPGGYNAIVLIELLEHISDPIGFLKLIKTYLKPAGKIFISTPVGETRSGNRNLVTYDTVEHVQFWTEESFALCCQKAGLRFAPVHAGRMYPRKNGLDAWARDTRSDPSRQHSRPQAPGRLSHADVMRRADLGSADNRIS